MSYIEKILHGDREKYKALQGEVGNFLADYGEKILGASLHMKDWLIHDWHANDHKDRVATELTRLYASLAIVRNGGTLHPDNLQSLEQAPATLAQARNILEKMYKPYFTAAKNGHARPIYNAPLMEGYNWAPGAKQTPHAEEWYASMTDLHEAREVLCGRILKVQTFSTIRASM
ncbi:MAG: hypothetical protein SFX19_01120 [Alphaproteobacteria bacterium]|nr:hypothetical protein [Alphaproteobacteria bacterium]